MAVLRLFWCSPCNARDRIHTLEAGRWWTCVVCRNQLDARDLPFLHGGSPDGPVVVSPATTGPSPKDAA